MLLNNILDSKNKMKLLREMALHNKWEYSINELAEATGIHRVLLSSLLKNMEDMNVVKIKTKGKIKLIRINTDNIFVSNLLIPLFEKEKYIPLKTAERLVKHFPKNNVISIVLFGSSVKKTFSFKSDIDFLFIFKKRNKKTEDKIIEKINSISDKGMRLSVDFMTISELKNLYKRKEVLIISIIRNHKTLYGKKLMEILK